MTSTLTVSGKVMGKSQPVFSNWELALPQAENSLTLRNLLAQIVCAEVAGFEVRQHQRRLMQILSPAEISLGFEQGKIDLGGSDLAQAVDIEQAIDIALQAFEDGLYFVFIDDRQQENLDDAVNLQPNSQLLFLRLVALVGG